MGLQAGLAIMSFEPMDQHPRGYINAIHSWVRDDHDPMIRLFDGIITASLDGFKN
jgi:hypothetical protein